MRKIRLGAMDVDGTLIGKDKILTKRTKEALAAAAARGIHLGEFSADHPPRRTGKAGFSADCRGSVPASAAAAGTERG